jgi:glycerate 2-kinase
MTPVSDSALDFLHARATHIFSEALNGCNIAAAFDRHIQFDGNTLKRLHPDSSGPEAIRLTQYRRIFIVALGKAAEPMLAVLLDRMKRRQGVRGICCAPSVPKQRNWRIRYFEGGHPLPNEESFAAARATLALLKKARKDTLILFLISGGGSAMFDLPLDPEIGLEETIRFHEVLLGSGAPINEINTLRKHFSAVKGGRLAIAAPEAMKVSFLLPDVPLRTLDALASGPTSPDHSTVEEVRAILAKYEIAPRLPDAVRAFFERDDLPESPGTKRALTSFLPLLPRGASGKHRRPNVTENLSGEDPAFQDSVFEVLLSSHDLVENARAYAQQAGYFVAVDNSCDDWDYKDAARYLLERFHELRQIHPRLCLISGGEVTVTLNETPGAGGRNQQFALACALELCQHEGALLTVLSAGSDGIDGNTKVAGAIANTTTVTRARAFGYDPAESLRTFNACPLFTALGDTVVTGPTGQNLRDLRILIGDRS